MVDVHQDRRPRQLDRRARGEGEAQRYQTGTGLELKKGDVGEHLTLGEALLERFQHGVLRESEQELVRKAQADALRVLHGRVHESL